jgi:Zn-dependent protease
VDQQEPMDIILKATRSGNVTLPLSPIIPDKYAPLAAVAAGVAITVIGTMASVSGLVSRLWEKIIELLEKFLSSETIGLMSVREIEKRGLHPSENLSAIIFGISAREMLVIGISTLGFAAAWILQDRLEVRLVTLIIFVCVGGIATILHDLAHKYCAYRAGFVTEYKLWGLGTVTMLSTAWLFGNAFAKPSRTLIRSEKKPSLEEAAIIKLAGPMVSLGVAVLSLFLIPLGGLFVIAGSAGFSMNLLNGVFSLVPVKPNDGVEVYAWNKFVWAIVFIPLIAFYLWVYLQM